MFLHGYKLFSIKIATFILSAVSFSLVNSWYVYTPVAERVPEVGYSSFETIFSLNFVPVFFVFLIIGLLLSPWIDKLVIENFTLRGIKGFFTFFSAYLLLGVAGGILISLFFFSPQFMMYYIRLSTLCAITFFLVQTLMQMVIWKIREP